MSKARKRQANGTPKQARLQSTPEVANKLDRALELHRKGWLAEAELLYREILKKHPKYFDALHLLGAMELQRGHYQEAYLQISAALKINAQSYSAHANLAYALVELERPEEALASCDTALAMKPDHADALCSRGNALRILGRWEEALASYDKALPLKPAEALHNRGAVLQILNRAEEALACVDRALVLKPDFPEAHLIRGNALNDLRRHEEALDSYATALALKPGYADALYNQGLVLLELTRAEEALANADRALVLNPRLAKAFLLRGNALKYLQRSEEALASYDEALAINPDYADVLCSRGLALLELQRYEEAIASFDRALAIEPDHAGAASNRIFVLDFLPRFGFAEHQEARENWYRAVAKHLSAGIEPHSNAADPSRRLVVGYVSADFKRHSAAACFGPVLKHHDRKNFEVVCYSGVTVEDEGTREFRRLADRWRCVSDLSDDALAEQIRADGIDILVDLSGHTAGNRLLVFARKPAPVQVTAFGYGVGTGLPAIDYLFSDPVAVPAAVRPLFAETIYDLPCMGPCEPPTDAPLVVELPALSRGLVTFGCLNRFSKVSQAALELWARILLKVPGSRLLLKDRALDSPAIQARVRDTLAGHGIGAERIELRGGSSHLDHLAAYNDVDIALDPFPQNGGMTTWESLWMGVPVVTKLGNSVSSRVCGAILHAIRLTGWVADGDEEYAALAVRQAGNPPALAQLRQDMRARITASPAGNLDLYTRVVEEAYRTMWRNYISGKKTDGKTTEPQATDTPNQASVQSTPEPANRLEQALELHRKGSLAEAEFLYREILEKHPGYFDALQLLGAVELQRGHYQEAYLQISEALRINPQSDSAHANLGYALVELKRPEEALVSCDKALAINPDHADALCSRGNALKDLGRPDEALSSFDKALALRPDYAEALYNRGSALQTLKRAEEALASLHRALTLKPDFPEALSTCGNVLKDLRRWEEALASYDKALALKPGYADVLYNRGLALLDLKRAQHALASIDGALAHRPDFAEALLVRGNALAILHRHDEALTAYDRALAIEPDYVDALVNRGSLLMNMQRHEEALASFDRALAIEPDHSIGNSSKIFALDFFPGLGFAEHQEVRRSWYRSLPKNLSKRVGPYPNVADPSRRLVVGYVSADFRRHSAASCFGPVLRRHDRADFEVVYYSGVTVEDEMTGEFRRLADRWRCVSDLSDDALAEQIRADGIDILVDLSGHTAGNRLLVFARKPAPVQVTAFGYGVGTGLPAIDYLFSDPVAVPAAVRPLFAETIYDLPCMGPCEPPTDAPLVVELPALSRGLVTFGCLNRFSKVSQAALELWARILLKVPGSRLLLKDRALDSPAIQARVRDTLAGHGIGAERIELRGGSSHLDHLAAYNDVDIALDPFPQNGGISTWESLWMGVPVVAKLGQAMPSRVSGAILHAAGLAEWVAGGDDDYAALAIRQASDLPALGRLRGEMRARIAASPAGNLETYTRAVEQAYRTMWRDCLSRATADHVTAENYQQ